MCVVSSLKVCGNLLCNAGKQIHWVLTDSYSAIQSSAQRENITITLEISCSYFPLSLHPQTPRGRNSSDIFLHCGLIFSVLQFHINRIILYVFFCCLASCTQHNFCSLSMLLCISVVFCCCCGTLFCDTNISQFVHFLVHEHRDSFRF